MTERITEIAFRTIDSFDEDHRRILIPMSLKVEDFRGWIEVKKYVDSDIPAIVTKLVPLCGTPGKRLREMMKDIDLDKIFKDWK